MTKAILTILAAGSLLATLGVVPAEAQQIKRTVADQPAATLLLPYFEVDLSDPNGITTELSVNNAKAFAMLANVVVWSDLAVPVLQFHVYLTGYDVQRIDMRDVLAGVLPRTASAGQDPTDQISPLGPKSQDINFASCAALLPPPPLSAADVAAVRAALTGGPSALFAGKCCGQNLGDNHARGYVTVDTVSQCSLLTPASVGYFAGIATNDNALWGDYAYVNRKRGEAAAVAGTLVHIVADPADPLLAVDPPPPPPPAPQFPRPEAYTFYGRYVDFDGSDKRLPLPTTFVARYVNAPQTSGEVVLGRSAPPVFTHATQLLVWRDPKLPQFPFTCGTDPAWFPLAVTDVVAFDEQETPQDIGPEFGGIFPPAPPVDSPFPAATQRVAVDAPVLDVDFASGWLFLNLNHTVVGPAVNPTAQAWVEVIHDPGGRFAVGYRGIQLDNAAQRWKLEIDPGGSVLIP